MLKNIKEICKVQSSVETEVHVGSHFCCHKCKYFNGNVGKKQVSCLRPD